MARRLIGIVLAGMLALVAGRGPAAAEWLSTVAERAGAFGAGKAGSSIEVAAARLGTIPSEKGTALAAHVGAEGHWTFLNKAGERFTAGTPDELKRVIGVLAPDASGKDARLTLVLTEDTVFKQRAALKDLPRGAELMIAIEGEAYPLVRRGPAATDTIFAEVRPNLLVELADRAVFDEAAWQLARPLERARIRVLALEPGGPVVIAATPKLDAQTRRALTDAIDPDKLAPALRSISGQTAVLTGRIAGEQLAFRTASGAEKTLVLKDLMAAAEAADVNLVILQSATPRQPGARNWLWQRAAVDGLDRAVERAHLADFLSALGKDQSRLMVSVTSNGQGRVALRAVPVGPNNAPLSGLSGIFSEIVSEIAGKVVTTGVEASMRSAARQRELDRRLVSWLPSSVQFAYLGCLALGLVGLGLARSWWGRLWPAERRDAYSGSGGYLAAHALRLGLFAFVFVPLVAVAAAPLTLLGSGRPAQNGSRARFAWPFRRAGARKT